LAALIAASPGTPDAGAAVALAAQARLMAIARLRALLFILIVRLHDCKGATSLAGMREARTGLPAVQSAMCNPRCAIHDVQSAMCNPVK
jgi:hypothetical protein